MTTVVRSEGSATSAHPETDALRLGRAYVEALLRGDFDAIEGLLAPRIRFRALIPRAMRQAATAAGARAWIEGWFGGTDGRELEIMRLVAGGLTSREIGSALFVSPRTVEMHVGSALAKLDCRTRAEAAQRVASLGLLD